MGGNVPASMKPIFAAAGAQYGIPANILAGIASVESDFGQNAGPSSAGAVGTMQFLPTTAKSLGVNPYDNRSAIFGTAKYLTQLGFHANPTKAIASYNAGPGNWTAGLGYAKNVTGEAARIAGQLRGVVGSGKSIAAGMSAPAGVTIPGKTSTNVEGALTDAMLRESASPVSGRVSSVNPLSDALSLINQGGYTSTSAARTIQLPSTFAGIAASKGLGAGRDINPLQHFTLGRTDMGVDANAKPGTPIPAMNDSTVVAIIPNWYQGQPYVALKLTAGPNKGKVWYVAEQISNVPKVGQSFRRGQTVTSYAPSGTGIEFGWADPTNPTQTLAQATGQTGTGDHSNAPAGVAIRNYLGQL